MPQDDAIARLARQIDAASKSERLSLDAPTVASLRRQGACELHRICAEFVSTINRALSEGSIELAPPEYAPEVFRENGVNVIQVSSQGRQMQITFEAVRERFSTEKFLVPYILEGEVRTYNQKMLDRLEVRNHLLFLCVEAGQTSWRFYDWRTAHTGIVDRGWLVNLMEPLF